MKKNPETAFDGQILRKYLGRNLAIGLNHHVDQKSSIHMHGTTMRKSFLEFCLRISGQMA
jgi:hypothetical protein